MNKNVFEKFLMILALICGIEILALFGLGLVAAYMELLG